MNADEARAFFSQNHRAVLATHRRDGGVQQSPVTAAIDDDGYVVISSRETAYKVKNLRNDPHAYLCGLTERFFGEWLYVEGQVEIVSLPEAMEGLVDYYRRASGEHPDWDDYRAAMVKDKRCLIRIPIEKAGPTRHG